MPRPPSQDLLDAVELIQQGKTPAELKEMGYKHDMSYRAARLVRGHKAFSGKSGGGTGVITVPDVPRKEIVLDTTLPGKRDRLITPTVIGHVGGVSDYVSATPTITRFKYPEFLPRARLILKEKFHWPIDQMPLDDILDCIIYYFFLDRGFVLDAYYQVENIEELKRIFYADGETGEIRPLAKEVIHATGARSQSPIPADGDEPGGGTSNPTGEGAVSEGEAGGNEIQRRGFGQDGSPGGGRGKENEPT